MTPAAVTFDNSVFPARLSFELNGDDEIFSIQSIGSSKVRYTTTGTFTGDVPVQGVTSLDLAVTPGFPVQVLITDNPAITGGVAKFLDSGANAYPATPTTITFDNNSGGVQFNGTTDFGFNVLSITADTTVSLKASAVLRTTADLLLGGDRLDVQKATPLIPGSVDAVIDAGAATVAIRPATPGQELNIGGDDFSGFLGLTDDELDRITAGFIQIGSTAAGNAKVTAPVSPANAPKLSVTTGGKLFLDPTFPAGDTAFTVGDLTVSAGTGVGTAAAPLTTAVDRVEATSTTVGVFLANAGPLTVGGTGAATGGIQVTGASGAVDVTATGTLTVNDKVLALGSVALTATGATSDVVFQHSKSRGVSSAGGTTTVRADRHILIGTASGYGDVGGQGLVLVAGGDIVVNTTSYVESNGAAGLQATAMGDVMILQSLGAGSVMNSNGGGAPVSITAGAGRSFVLDQGFNGGVAANGGPVTIAADNLTLTSGRIGTTGLVTLKPASAGRAVSLGAEVAGQLSLTDDELDLVSLPPPPPPTPTVQLQIGDSATGAITLGGDISRPSATNLGLVSGSDIASTLGAGAIDTAGGTLVFTPGPGGSVKPLRSGTDVTASATSFAGGAGLTIDVSGPTADTQYTRFVTSGSIDLSGVDLVLTGAYTPGPGDVFTIVSADGGVTGTLTGLPDGTTFSINGQRVAIRYSATAVTLSVVMPTLTATVTGGVLTITDTAGAADALTVTVNGANLVITDPTQAFIAAPAGGTLSNGDQTLTIPLAGLTGLSVQLGGGDDTLTIDYSGGVIPVPVEFAGGGQATATGDALVVTGGSFATATHTFAAADSGVIDFGGAAGAITYSGLEPVDMTGTTVGNLVLNLPTAIANQAVLEANGSFNQIRSLNGTFETTAFSDPTGSLTINRGTDQDTLSATDLPNFTASLALGAAAAPFAAVSFDGSLTLAAGNTLAAAALSVAATTGTVAVTDGTVTVLADQVTLAAGTALTAGTGVVTLAPVTDGRAIDLGGPDTATALGLTDAELDAVTASRLTVGRAGAGAVTVSAPVSIAPVAVPLFEIMTGGDVTDGSATGADLTAAALAVTAGGEVGVVADPLDTAVTNLEVTAAGGVFVTDSGPAVTVGGVLLTLTGVLAGGPVQITASAGSLTVQEAVGTSNGGVVLTAGGVLAVATTVTSAADVTLAADEIDLTGGAGNAGGRRARRADC
ncbi:hypothetical protein J0H58_03640 [bacterium]|nr:hypothetical protein [bacterium]